MMQKDELSDLYLHG